MQRESFYNFKQLNLYLNEFVNENATH